MFLLICLDDVQGFVAGSLAAVIAGCVTHPIDLIKARAAINHPIFYILGEKLASPDSLPYLLAVKNEANRPTRKQVRMQIENSAPGRYGDFLPTFGNAGAAPRASLGILRTTAFVVRNEGFLGLYAGISGAHFLPFGPTFGYMDPKRTPLHPTCPRERIPAVLTSRRYQLRAFSGITCPPCDLN